MCCVHNTHMGTCETCGKEFKNLNMHQRLAMHYSSGAGVAPALNAQRGGELKAPSDNSKLPPQVGGYHSLISPALRELQEYKMQQALIHSIENENKPAQNSMSALDILRTLNEFKASMPNQNISEIIKAVRDLRDFSSEFQPQSGNSEDKLLESFAENFFKAKVAEGAGMGSPTVPPQSHTTFNAGDAMDFRNYLPLIKSKINSMSNDEFLAVVDAVDTFFTAEFERRKINVDVPQVHTNAQNANTNEKA